MGSKKEFNWILKLSEEDSKNLEDLVAYKKGKFSKEGDRVYPTNIPIFLADSKFNILAAVEVRDYSYDGTKNTINGEYWIKRVFDENQRDFLTGLYKDLYSKQN